MSNSSESNSTERVSLEQVLRVADLAQLELTAAEQQEMLRDLNSVLGYVDQLNELNTAEVPAMAQVGSALRETGTAETTGGSALREDTLRPSLDRATVMGQAPDSDGTYFKVPKVIER